MRVQIAAVYFASTCQCTNERALCSVQPNCAFNGPESFALCCFSAVTEFGARGAPEGHANPRGALAPGWGAPEVVVPCEAGRESLHKTDLFLRKVL